MLFEDTLVFGNVWFIPAGEVESIVEHVAVSQCGLLDQNLQIVSVEQCDPEKTGALHDCKGPHSVFYECVWTYLLHKIQSHDVSVVLDEAFAPP